MAILEKNCRNYFSSFDQLGNFPKVRKKSHQKSPSEVFIFRLCINNFWLNFENALLQENGENWTSKELKKYEINLWPTCVSYNEQNFPTLSCKITSFLHDFFQEQNFPHSIWQKYVIPSWLLFRTITEQIWPVYQILKKLKI